MAALISVVVISTTTVIPESTPYSPVWKAAEFYG